MKLKHQIIAYSMIPALLGLGFVGINSASAHGMFGGFGGWGMFGNTLSDDEIAARHQAMFQKQADFLGISVNDVKAAWAQGKSLQQLANEKDITNEQLAQKLRDAHLAQLKSQLQTLVSKGIITQAQADQRLKLMQDKQTKINGKNKFKHGWGLGMMRGLGI